MVIEVLKELSNKNLGKKVIITSYSERDFLLVEYFECGNLVESSHFISKEHSDKLNSYKSISALMKYVYKNQIVKLCPPTVIDDMSRVDAPYVPNLSSPTTGDTLFFHIDVVGQCVKVSMIGSCGDKIELSTNVTKPDISKAWRKILKFSKDKKLFFRDVREQKLFLDVVKKSFGYDNRLLFKDILKNDVDFVF